MSILFAISQYVVTSNNIFIELEETLDSFEKEIRLIDEVKCHLINYKDLDEFQYDGAYVYEYGAGYRIIMDELNIEIEVNDGVIIDYDYF